MTVAEPWFGQPPLVHWPCGGTQTEKPDEPYALQMFGAMQLSAAGLHES
jgi:hypothetical protein